MLVVLSSRSNRLPCALNPVCGFICNWRLFFASEAAIRTLSRIVQTRDLPSAATSSHTTASLLFSCFRLGKVASHLLLRHTWSAGHRTRYCDGRLRHRRSKVSIRCMTRWHPHETSTYTQIWLQYYWRHMAEIFDYLVIRFLWVLYMCLIKYFRCFFFANLLFAVVFVDKRLQRKSISTSLFGSPDLTQFTFDEVTLLYVAFILSVWSCELRAACWPACKVTFTFLFIPKKWVGKLVKHYIIQLQNVYWEFLFVFTVLLAQTLKLSWKWATL